MPKFTIFGTLTPFVHVSLQQGERFYAESDAMVSMDTTIDLEGKTRGSIGSSLLNFIANDESFFMQNFTATRGPGDVLLAPVTPGQIEILDVGKQQYLLNDGAFIAAEDTVSLTSATQSITQALGGGSGGFIVNKTSGQGKIAVSGLGDIFALDITPGQETIIDNGHLVAWDATLQCKVSVSTSQGKGLFKSLLNSATSGEGFVTRFNGSGKVYICSRNQSSFIGWIASHIPTK